MKSARVLNEVTLFLCGDVMTGRGIDQILAHPGDPRLFEPYVRSAQRYVELAENVNGPIPRPAADSYVWGDALEELDRIAPDMKIINLETSVTAHRTPWPGKPIHYRMHPKNVACLTAADPDCCVLANNHVLDWGTPGLLETLDTLHGAGLVTAGGGRGIEEAAAPTVLPIGERARVLVYAIGIATSGIPDEWAAAVDQPGVHFAPDLSSTTVRQVADHLRAVKRERDVVVVSIHWGGNWGYDIAAAEREFAHALIDLAGVDVVHGHSSHHPKGIEVYRDRPIIYGCGDFLNDYEGIPGYEQFRDDLVLMYFPAVDPASGSLALLRMIPLQIHRFRLHRTSADDAQWLCRTLTREGEAFGTRVERGPDGDLWLRWKPSTRGRTFLSARTGSSAPPRRTTAAGAPHRRTHARDSA